MDLRIAVISGPFAGQTIPLAAGKLVIGREPDSHIVLDNPLVSRHHCVLLLDEWTLRIRDLGSKNGTFVNGNRLGAEEHALSHGDVVSIGVMAFRIESGEAHVPTGSIESETTQFDSKAPKKEEAGPAQAN